ncbi:MAG: hypothetical protein H6736_02110 [Alphaproteobacteria bacterium]|nr:hypothetical protein [Alphaproteobacteria bacterium]MCB9690584.1 hypothetical protein [Alphaproteobacteria bacterium]
MRSLLPSPRISLYTLALLAGGCVQDVGIGPELGACSEPPDGPHGYGEVGIGSCLAGPTDVTFVTRGGAPWLAVANSDPFINFSGGSVLLLDWESVMDAVEAGERDIMVDQLTSAAVPTERFVGALGWLPARDEMLVTRRLTPGGRTRAGEDSAYLLDLLEPGIVAGGDVPLKDDPGDLVVDEAEGRAYALNFTDHSISVLDVSGGPVRPIDLAPEASLTELPFEDADGDGSVAELDRFVIGIPKDVPSDLWTLSWIPGTVRVWIPDGDALTRASSGGGSYVADPVGGNVDFGVPIADPVVTQAFVNGEADPASLTALVFAGDGAILGTESGGTVDLWTAPDVVLSGASGSWQEELSGPSISEVDGTSALFYAGHMAADPAHRSIGLSVQSASGAFLRAESPLLEAPAGESYEQPFAQVDPRIGSGRLWLSHHDGTHYRILTTTFDDLAKQGLSLGPLEVSLDLGDTSVAAPVVRWLAGEYHLWAARDDGDHWTHVTARSADGITWSAPADLFVSTAPYDPRQPPRLAVEHDEVAAWRLRGRDAGANPQVAVPGVRLVDLQNGYSFTVANGHEVSSDALFPLGRAAGGLRPTSHVVVDGANRLYVTVRGDDGRDRVAVLDDATGPLDVLRQDLIPQGTGGNVAGASDPVVFRPDGGPWVMFYAAWNATGQSRVRAATSDDGRLFTPVGDALFPDLADWATGQQLPHAVEVQDDGSVLLWLSGNDGARWRIGAVRIEGLVSDPTAATYTLDPLQFTDFQLAPGAPGGADDSGVKDPVVVQDGDQRVLWYAGFDGLRWSVCQAVFDGVEWRRRQHRETDATLPAMSAALGTFTTAGMDSPVYVASEDGPATIWYAGHDATDGADDIPRLGRAVVHGHNAFPAFRQPTFGDTLMFESQRGDDVTSVIELGQDVDAFATSGVGTTSLVHDTAAGMMYVPSKLTNLLYVVDVREDVRVGRPDANAMDMETVVRLPSVQNSSGYRGGVLDAARDRLYLTIRNPDALVVLDTSLIVDDDDKEVTDGAFIATLPLQDDRQDRGAASVASIGGAQPLLAGDLLVVPNFSDNSLSIFDLTLGVAGAEVAYVPFVGENPHTAALSPDGRYAVIANYLGDVDGKEASSTLALLDLDPTSPDYLTVQHWIRNR